METDILLGDHVILVIDGHSANNGAPIPEGSVISVANNGPDVCTIPDSVEVPPGGAQHFELPVVVLEKGSADAHIKVVDPQGVIYESTATLVVSEPVPGLTRISAEFVKV